MGWKTIVKNIKSYDIVVNGVRNMKTNEPIFTMKKDKSINPSASIAKKLPA